jgi:hypothetical protein
MGGFKVELSDIAGAETTEEMSFVRTNAEKVSVLRVGRLAHAMI